MSETGDAGGATYVGPFDREPWPEQLEARVVSPGAAPRLHGYDVAGDLARHYTMSEVAWLALRGELPTEHERAAFDAALILLSPTHVAQAPAHAAILTRIAAAQPSATVGVAAVGLGELARCEREALTASAKADADADSARAHAAADSATTDDTLAWLDERMRTWFGEGHGLPPLPRARVACAHALLHRLGFSAPLHLELLSVWARLPAVLAEAALVPVGAVRSYPARAPDYRYVDEEGAAP